MPALTMEIIWEMLNKVFALMNDYRFECIEIKFQRDGQKYIWSAPKPRRKTKRAKRVKSA